MNFTVQAPTGTTNHGDPHLICTPATWRDYISFFALNYFIHAATLPAVPGETKREMVFAVINALFVPGFGLVRALRRLLLRPGLQRKRPLGCALAAGALCMVVSDKSIDEWSPIDSWAARTFKYRGHLIDLKYPRTRRVHGAYSKLPPSYNLYAVPVGARIEPIAPPAAKATPTPPRSAGDGENDDSGPWQGRRFEPANEYNVVKILFSLVQAVAGGITIYRARGDQVRRYGCGAFGLSVVPYVFMSVVNIAASLLSPEFPVMYLVHTPDVDEAEMKHGCYFDGLVGRLVVPALSDVGGDDKIRGDIWFFQGRLSSIVLRCLVWFVLVAAPLAIVGALSGFSGGEDGTISQRGWILSWLVVGSVSSAWIAVAGFMVKNGGDSEPQLHERFSILCFFIGVAVLFWVPAIGGMVTVGLELREYGICTRIG